MEKIYRAALIGCGRMGVTIDDEMEARTGKNPWFPHAHGAAVVACERTELVGVADVVKEKTEAARKRFETPECYEDYRVMIEREAPDIVCIATRPATHADAAIFAAQHGVKGIFCEKPLCCSMAEADAMVAALAEHGVKFNYGTQRRYVPVYRKLREMIDSGEVGTPLCVIGQQGTSAALWGLTHGSDMMLFLAGDQQVEYVQGTAIYDDDDLKDNLLEDDPGIASGYVRFANGLHGYFTAGTGFEFEVCGTEGKLRSYNDAMSCSLRKSSEGKRQMDEVAFPEVPRESGSLNAIKDLVEAMDTGGETKGPIELAALSQEMLMGIVESHRLGGLRVTLPMENRALAISRKGW